MLVCSKTRYLSTIPNVITLEKDGVYFYIDRGLYDKSTILEDRYDKEFIDKYIGKVVNEDIVNWFYENAPRPINMLGSFLNLVEEELEPDMEICCGVLHVIFSTGLDPKRFILSPVEMRASITFSMSIKNEYKASWDTCMISFLPFNDIDSMIISHNIMNKQPNVENYPINLGVPYGFQTINPMHQGYGYREMYNLQHSNQTPEDTLTEEDLEDDEVIFEDTGLDDFADFGLSKEDMEKDIHEEIEESKESTTNTQEKEEINVGSTVKSLLDLVND